jgi:hypothetical protein
LTSKLARSTLISPGTIRVKYIPWPLRVIFLLSSECFQPPLTGSASLPDYHKNHLTFVDTSPVVPMVLLEKSLGLSVFVIASPWSSLSAWPSREPSDLSGLYSDSPPWLACKFPLEFPLRVICRTVLVIFRLRGT